MFTEYKPCLHSNMFLRRYVYKLAYDKSWPELMTQFVSASFRNIATSLNTQKQRAEMRKPMNDTRKFGVAPSIETFAAIAQSTLEALPQPFAEHAARVSVRIFDLADEETLEALAIENPYELTGLYSGVALTLDAVSAPALDPAIIWLYRLPIIDEWAARGDVTLEELVSHVLIHELGHHFGWSDDDMDAALEASD